MPQVRPSFGLTWAYVKLAHITSETGAPFKRGISRGKGYPNLFEEFEWQQLPPMSKYLPRGENVNARAAAVFLGIVSLATMAFGQESSPLQPYTDKDAYQIYNLLIPNEEIWGNGTRIIQEDTVQGGAEMMNVDSCASPSAAPDFEDAIANFKAANNKKWLLQREFNLDRPYELVNSNTIQASFKAGEQNRVKGEPGLAGGWRGFYERYPGSGGFVILSAVGFNTDKTRAVVFSGANCGSLCGRWSFHLFKKIAGKWTGVPGVTRHAMS